MDWYKTKVCYTLYSDFNDKQFRAYHNLMALTAQIETMPTKEQMLKICHYKTLTSLEEYFINRSITLQDVLNKVLIDVQGVLNKRAVWKNKKQVQRLLREIV